MIEVREREQKYRYVDVAEKPVLSINRGFSSPVRVNAGLRESDLLFLMTHDRDPFNRWEAGQSYATGVLIAISAATRAGQVPRKEPGSPRPWPIPSPTRTSIRPSRP